MLVLESKKHTGMYFIPFDNDDRCHIARTAEFCSEGNIKVYLLSCQDSLIPKGELELLYYNPSSRHEYIPVFFNARLV